MKELISSFYTSLFGDPIQNEKGYPMKKISQIASVDMGGTPSTKKPEYYKNGTILWMKSGDIKKDFLREEDIPNRITDLGLTNCNAKLYRREDVVIALNGQGKTRATAAILLTDTTSNQSVANFSPNKEILSEYLLFNLKYRYAQLRALTGDKSRSGLNLRLLRNLDLVCPPIALQRKFSDFVNRIEKLSLVRERSVLLTNTLYDEISRALRVEN